MAPCVDERTANVATMARHRFTAHDYSRGMQLRASPVLRPLQTSDPQGETAARPGASVSLKHDRCHADEVNTVSHTYAPTMFAVAMLIAAIAVMAGNWLLVVAVVCALLAGAHLARHHPSRRNRKLH
jgi:hypothetical protein